jgi:hypothetical protein
VPEVIADRLGAAIVTGIGRHTLAQQAAQHWPALAQARSIGWADSH